MKKILTLLIIAVAVAACKKDDAPVKVTGVTLNKTTLEYVSGEGETLTVEVVPQDAENKTITWSSSDPTIAVVDQTGKVKALRVGQATITATAASGVSASSALTVKMGIGGCYPDAVSPLGIIFRVKTATQSGLAVSLTESSSNLLWISAAFETHATDLNNGMVNMTTIQNYINDNGKNWDDFPAFKYVIATLNGQTAYDATRDKWYLPSKNEMRELMAATSGKVYTELTSWNSTMLMPDFDDASCIAARAAFNEKLVAAGGMKIENDNLALSWYWVSTEYGQYTMWSYGFANGAQSFEAKEGAYRRSLKSRAILAF